MPKTKYLSCNTFTPVFIGVLLVLQCLNTHAADTTKKLKLFQESSAIPPGFESISDETPQTTMVSVFYGKRLVVNTFATFDNDTITFENPKDILVHIQGLKYLKTLKTALENALPNHSQFACKSQSVGYCQAIKPASIGVIFDRDNLKAHLFINPKFIEASKIKPYTLPNSSASSSVISHNHFIYSKLSSTTYSLNTNTLAGYGNGYFKINTYYTHKVTPGSSNTADLIRFSQLAGQYYHNGSLYSAGVLPTGGNGQFTQTVAMIGAKYQNFFDEGSGAHNTQGNPVTIFLPTPAQVEVYRAGELIYANDFPAGKHQINTSSFPVGSYDITIRITNSLREVTEEQRFFAKRPSNIDINQTRYAFALGEIERNDLSIDRNASIKVQLPELSGQGVFSLDRDQLLSHQIDWNLNLISNFERHYLSTEFHYLGNNYTASPGALVSNQGQYGYGADFHFNHKPFKFDIEGARFYGTERILENTESTKFLPLSVSKYYISTNTTYMLKGNSLSLYARWQKNINQAYTHAITFNVNRQIWRNSYGSLSLRASASKTQADKILTLGLSATFSSAYVDGQGVLAYQRDNIGNVNQGRDNLSSSVNLSKRSKINEGHIFEWNTGISHDYVGTDYRAKINYVSVPLRARASVLRNENRSNESNTNLSAQVDTSFVLADNTFGLGYSNNLNAGLIVDISSPEDGQTQIIANNRTIATIANNTATPIFLAPYRTYSITINPKTAATQYSFDTNPKTITLYRGNIQHLNWQLEERFILFAEVVGPKGNPLPMLLLQQKNAYNTTDEAGFIQANISDNTKKLDFVSMTGQRCTVHLPANLKPDNGIIYLDQPLRCHLKEPSDDTN